MIVLRLGRVSRGGMYTYRAYCLLPFRIRTRIERTTGLFFLKEVRDIQWDP